MHRSPILINNRINLVQKKLFSKLYWQQTSKTIIGNKLSNKSLNTIQHRTFSSNSIFTPQKNQHPYSTPSTSLNVANTHPTKNWLTKLLNQRVFTGNTDTQSTFIDVDLNNLLSTPKTKSDTGNLVTETLIITHPIPQNFHILDPGYLQTFNHIAKSKTIKHIILAQNGHAIKIWNQQQALYESSNKILQDLKITQAISDLNEYSPEKNNQQTEGKITLFSEPPTTHKSLKNILLKKGIDVSEGNDSTIYQLNLKNINNIGCLAIELNKALNHSPRKTTYGDLTSEQLNIEHKQLNKIEHIKHTIDEMTKAYIHENKHYLSPHHIDHAIEYRYEGPNPSKQLPAHVHTIIEWLDCIEKNIPIKNHLENIWDDPTTTITCTNSLIHKGSEFIKNLNHIKDLYNQHLEEKKPFNIKIELQNELDTLIEKKTLPKGENSINIISLIDERNKHGLSSIKGHIGAPLTKKPSKFPYKTPSINEIEKEAATTILTTTHPNGIYQNLTPNVTNSAKNNLDMTFRFFFKQGVTASITPGYGPTYDLARINHTPLKEYDMLTFCNGDIRKINHNETINKFIAHLNKDAQNGRIKNIIWQPFTIGANPSKNQCKQVADIVNTYQLGYLEERLYAEILPQEIIYNTPTDFIQIGNSSIDPFIGISLSSSKYVMGSNGGLRATYFFSNKSKELTEYINMTSTSVSTVAREKLIELAQGCNERINNKPNYVEAANAGAKILRKNNINCNESQINGFILADFSNECKRLNVTGPQLQQALMKIGVFLIQGQDILSDEYIFRISFLGYPTIKDSETIATNIITALRSKELKEEIANVKQIEI